MIAERFAPEADLVLYEGNCLDLLKSLPDSLARLVVASPPYNLGKAYEIKLDLEEYLTQQATVIRVRPPA